MTVTAPRSRMTAEELFDLPDDGGRSELVEGELVPRTRLAAGMARWRSASGACSTSTSKRTTSASAAAPRPGSS